MKCLEPSTKLAASGQTEGLSQILFLTLNKEIHFEIIKECNEFTAKLQYKVLQDILKLFRNIFIFICYKLD